LRLIDYLNKNLIFLDIEAQNRDDALSQIIHMMYDNHAIADANQFLSEVQKRESLGSTAIGTGFALPHARTQNVNQIVVAIARLKKGVDFGAEDKEDIKVIFLLGTPVNSVGEYLKVLARISKLLRQNSVRKGLLKAKNQQDVLALFEDTEELEYS
jgi:fructose-specific phosphotransferase system IIA component